MDYMDYKQMDTYIAGLLINFQLNSYMKSQKFKTQC